MASLHSASIPVSIMEHYAPVKECASTASAHVQAIEVGHTVNQMLMLMEVAPIAPFILRLV